MNQLDPLLANQFVASDTLLGSSLLNCHNSSCTHMSGIVSIRSRSCKNRGSNSGRVRE